MLRPSPGLLYTTGVAQLSDINDGARPLTLEAAFAHVASMVEAVGENEEVLLAAADGRVTSEQVVSPCDLPPFDNSAVDGYAVTLADVETHKVLPVEGRLAAGTNDACALAPATAMRVFTGARLPSGADTVFMQEDVRLERGAVAFTSGLSRGANIRRRGEDIGRGMPAIPAGRRIRPQDLALAAALGLQVLTVVRRLRVALFSTGDEIVDPGASPGAGQRFDSNRIMLAALLGRAGAIVTDLGILRDDMDATRAALASAETGHDLILTSGGVSVGEEDHVKAAVASLGAISLSRLAIKPGRPIAIGRIGRVPFVGLPGNPVAAFVTFTRVIRPMLALLAGETYVQESFSVTAAFSHRKRKGTREYLRVAVERDAAGALCAKRHPVEGAAILTSLTTTSGLVELPENVTEVRTDDILTYLPYEGLL